MGTDQPNSTSGERGSTQTAGVGAGVAVRRVAVGHFNLLDAPLSTLEATDRLITERGTRMLPVNEDGSLEGYYDPQSLGPEDELVVVPLTYMDGIPYLPHGTPFWERLEGEPQSCYEAFKHYLHYPYAIIGSGAQGSLETERILRQNPAARGSMAQQRNMSQIAQDLQPQSGVRGLGILAALYAWSYRAKEYDLYIRRGKELRMKYEVAEMESSHAGFAKKMLAKAKEALEEMDPGELTPTALKDFAQTATQIERLSRQLDPTKPSPIGGNQPGGGRGRGSTGGKDAGGDGGVTVQNTEGGTVQIQVVYTDNWRSS